MKKRKRCTTRVNSTNGAKLISNSSGRNGFGTPSTSVVRDSFTRHIIQSNLWPGRFEETPYLVTHPRPERRQLPPSSCPANVEVPESSQGHAQPEPDAPEEEEIAVARRIPAATLRVWESLLAPRGYAKVGSELIKTGPAEASNSIPDPPLSLPRIDKGKGKARPADLSGSPPSGKGRSALATFTRSKSFAPSTTPAPDDPSGSTSRRPFRKVQSLFLPGPSSPAQVAPELGASPPKIFVGMRFRVRAEARSASVRSAIEGCGGTWVEDEDEEDRVDFVIVRLVRYSYLPHLRYYYAYT
jgi:DNA replication regulator DPB11